MKPSGSQLIAEFIGCSNHAVLNDCQGLEEMLATGIRESGLTLISTTGHQFDPVGLTVVALIGESHAIIHTYPEARHASIDIFTCSAGSERRNDLLEFLKDRLKPSTVRIVDIHRGNPLDVKDSNWITSFSSNHYETRYHIEKLLYSSRSQYQQIDIIENENFGKMMFLDKDLQIAERDAHVYNRNLVRPLIDAGLSLDRVAILGGGDGGVLSELLKYAPRYVALVDIDGQVIEASRKHLTSICGVAFDHPNTDVRVEDANVFLENEKDFDAIVYDLTMYPEALTCNERATFLDGIFSRVEKSLKPNGVLSLQCCSEFDGETSALLEQILSSRFKQLEFRKCFIPSFCENWVFGSARLMQPSAVDSVRRVSTDRAANLPR